MSDNSATEDAPLPEWDRRVPHAVRTALIVAANEAVRAGARRELADGAAYAGEVARIQDMGRWRITPDRQRRVNLVAHLTRKGLSQRDIASKLGIGQATICRDLEVARSQPRQARRAS